MISASASTTCGTVSPFRQRRGSTRLPPPRKPAAWRRGAVPAIELLLVASMLFSLAALTYALARVRSVEWKANVSAHYRMFKDAADPWHFSDRHFDQLFSDVSFNDDAWQVRDAPDFLSLESLPIAPAWGVGRASATAPAGIFGRFDVSLVRRAVTYRPAWTWRSAPGVSILPFLPPLAHTQTWVERSAVREWYDGAVEATSGRYEDDLQLSDPISR